MLIFDFIATIFAHIAQAKSNALGAAVYMEDGILYGVAGPIKNDFVFNLNDNDFSDEKFYFTGIPEDHCAQFLHNNMIRYEYWEILLGEKGFDIQ